MKPGTAPESPSGVWPCGVPWAIADEAFGEIRAEAEAAAMMMGQTHRPERRDYDMVGSVAVVPVTGVLYGMAAPWWRSSSYPAISRAVAVAGRDPEVTAILLAVDSPGGMTSGLAGLIGSLAAVQKPVHAYVERGLSAACYMLSAVDRVTVGKACSLGALGVILAMERWSPPEVDGHKMEVRIVSGGTPRKDWAAAFGDDKKARQALADMQQQADATHAQLMEACAEAGKRDLTAVADGRQFTGDEAVAVGLADDVGTEQAALMALAQLEDERMAEENAQTENAAKIAELEADLKAANEKAEAAAAKAADAASTGEQSLAAERERVAAIMALPGDDAVKTKGIKDGQTVGDVAVALLEANAAAGRDVLDAREQHTNGADPPASASPPSGSDKGDDLRKMGAAAVANAAAGGMLRGDYGQGKALRKEWTTEGVQNGDDS